jgi:hypothetical protein
MRKHLIFVIAILAIALPAFSQFTEEEIAERPKWEEFLETAEIVNSTQLTGREAVTKPWRLSLKNDDIANDAIWKDVEGRLKGFIEGWKYEIAAYRFDKYLGLNMVPPTVEKRFREKRGSCQFWVKSWKSLRQIKEEKIKVPPIKLFYYNRAINVQRVFDNLIANEDRHLNNYLFTDDWRMILIDHSRSFRTGKKWTTQLIYSEKHREKLVMKECPRAIFEKIKVLNYDIIKGFVGEYLSDDEINAVLERKDLILKEIETLVQQKGEENVLY